MTRRTLLASFILAPFASMLSRWGAFGNTASPGAGPRALYFPNVLLRTHENKTVRFYDDLVKGKIVLINFMYAKCEGLCPRQTANLVQVQQALGKHVGRDIFMYSITLKPEQDSPQVLQEYARAYGFAKLLLTLRQKPLQSAAGSGGPSPTAKPGELPPHADLRYGPPRLERPKANGTKALLRASHFRNGRDCAQRIPDTFRATWS